jgi:hypothetical protein
MYNPERKIIGNLDRNRLSRSELSPLIVQAHEKAVKEVLTNPDYVIQESEFASVYGAERVAADMQEADRLEKIFKREETPHIRNSKIIAETLEAVVLMHSEMSNWLGNAQTLKTSRFDDYKNKVDMIAEWSSPADGTRVLALGVDVTFGTGSIEKKMLAIKKEIDADELGSIRYFKDTRGDFVGTRNNVPRTVIGVSQPIVTALAGLWLNNQQKALATHPIQELFISEIEQQLRAMHAYAIRQKKTKAVLAYQQALAAVHTIRQDKPMLRENTLSDDPVAQSISMQARDLFR